MSAVLRRHCLLMRSKRAVHYEGRGRFKRVNVVPFSRRPIRPPATVVRPVVQDTPIGLPCSGDTDVHSTRAEERVEWGMKKERERGFGG